ncbi:hypothetical protein [Paracoccus homiensis]|uniref:hypothetical protein n=1 Tax=Paracoccus homiensis TaxID=364199 RepID=UPI00398D5E5F
MAGRAHFLQASLLALSALTLPAHAQSTAPQVSTVPTALRWPEELRPAIRPAWRQPAPGPAVIDTADPLIPGAREVLTDTPNVFAWSRYQTGRIDGWSYRLFPDGSALIVAEDGRVASEYLLRCQIGEACQISNDAGVILNVPAIAAPKPSLPTDIAGLSLARYLAEWMLAGTGTPPPPPPEPAPVPQVETPDPVAEQPPEPAAPIDETPPQNLFVAEQVECGDPDPFYPDSCVYNDPPPNPVRAETPSDPATPPQTAAQTAPLPVPAPDKPEPEQPLTLAQKYKLACSVSTGAGLQYTDHIDQSKSFGKFRVSLGCNVQFSDRVKLAVSFIEYPISDQQAPWDPDFTYALDIRVTEKLSLSYSNYSARFSGDDIDLVSSLLKGSLRASYKLPSIPYFGDRQMNCSFGLGLSNPSTDAVSLFCHSSITRKLWAGFTLYAYPADAQEPWNPDYSYLASYRINDRMSLNYSNYSSNRWPWNRGSDPGPGILGGSLSLSYKIIF